MNIHSGGFACTRWERLLVSFSIIASNIHQVTFKPRPQPAPGPDPDVQEYSANGVPLPPSSGRRTTPKRKPYVKPAPAPPPYLSAMLQAVVMSPYPYPGDFED